MIAISLLTLLHLLVFVYWLGGDLGAFYGSTFMVDPKRSVAERLLALKLLNNIDMAPRTALILALPTGLALAWMKRWVEMPAIVPAAAAAAGAAWLALAWAVHLRHGTAEGLRRLDLAIRYVVAIALSGIGVASLAGVVTLPLFIALKLLVLAGCIGLGLLVRVQLVPLFVAVREMVASAPTPTTDATIAVVNGRVRIAVLGIWVLIAAAAYLGIATPV